MIIDELIHTAIQADRDREGQARARRRRLQEQAAIDPCRGHAATSLAPCADRPQAPGRARRFLWAGLWG
jgi:hypothetical protein